MLTPSFGISTPKDLFEKLGRDAEKIEHTQCADDIFNFFATANSLSEWIEKYYSLRGQSKPLVFGKGKKGKHWTIPDASERWVDASKIPGKTGGEAAIFHIKEVLSLCSHIANATKHFGWTQEQIIRFANNPPVENLYQYFTQEFSADLCVDIGEFRYSIRQITHIIISFYGGLITFLENQKN